MASSVAEAVRGGDAVTVLPGSPDVAAFVSDPDGVLEHADRPDRSAVLKQGMALSGRG